MQEVEIMFMTLGFFVPENVEGGEYRNHIVF